MTVAELIELLEKLPDKKQLVCFTNTKLETFELISEIEQKKYPHSSVNKEFILFK